MACPLGSLELNATEARLLARDATDVLTTTITHARATVGGCSALYRKVADPRWVAGPLLPTTSAAQNSKLRSWPRALPARAPGGSSHQRSWRRRPLR